MITVALMHPIMGSARLWASKTLASSPDGSATRTVAEIVAVLA